MSQTIAALTSEKEASEASAREREKKLLTARDQLILQHDEAMLRAENDKQQALLMGEILLDFYVGLGILCINPMYKSLPLGRRGIK